MSVTVTNESLYNQIEDISVSSRGIEILGEIKTSEFQGHIIITFHDKPPVEIWGQHHVADFQKDYGFRFNINPSTGVDTYYNPDHVFPDLSSKG
jgi:hypothetical protein